MIVLILAQDKMSGLPLNLPGGRLGLKSASALPRFLKIARSLTIEL